MSVDIDTLVGKYVELRDGLERIDAEAKAKKAPLTEAMGVIQGALMKLAIEQKVTSFKTQAGTAFITEKSYCGVLDFAATLEHCKSSGDFSLLTKAVNKTAVQEYIDKHEAVPPGVKWTVEKEIQVRRK